MKTFLSRYLSAAQRFFFAFLALVAISNYSLAQDGPNTAPHIEQLKQVGASMNDAHEGARQTGCTLPVWHSGYPSRIFAMPRSARNFGFRVGDYIVSVNGQSMPRESEGLDDILGSIPGDGSVDVVIHRSGENMTVTAECADIAEFNRYYSGVIDAMLAGDGQACANAIGDLGNWAGVTTSQFGELRIMCLMAGDPTMSH